MSELKSINDLNPVKAEIDEVKDTVLNTNVTDGKVESQVEEPSEAVDEEEKSKIYHDDLSYIDPNEDTSLGTGLFDFGRSINARRQLLDEKLAVVNEEKENIELEKEMVAIEDKLIEEDSDNNNYSFNDGADDIDDDIEIDTISKVSAIPVPAANKEISKKNIKTYPVIPVNNNDIPNQSDLFIDDDDLDDLDDIEAQETDMEEKEIEILKGAITEKLKISEKNFDITGFTISKQPISANAALDYDETSKQVFDWPLMSAGRLVSMNAFSGTEIDALNGGNSRNRFNNLKDIYRELYNHIIDPKKPDFESWLKLTSFMDIPHLYMAAYKSSFHGANYIPFTCTDTKCNHIFLSDDIDILENMVKFKDEDSKLKFNEIMENGSIPANKAYETRIVPISSKFAIGFREPSIYNTIFENVILDQKFVEKYQRLLSMMIYIDTIYLINGNNLSPIAYKIEADNIAKTTKYRIMTYAKIISKLPSDSFQKITSIIASINELGNEITYQLPEVTCPECSHVIPAEIKESMDLLFSRHQLALIANS